MRSALSLLVLVPALGVAATTPLDCPKGSRLDVIEKAGNPLKVETCKDVETGVREGPMRVTRADGFVEASGRYSAGKLDGEYFVFGNDGRPELRIVYDAGRKTDEKLTRLGLERRISEINANAGKADKSWRMSVVDDRTVGYTVRIHAPYSWFTADEQELHSMMIREPTVCAFFDLPTEVETVLVRYTDADGKELASVAVTQTDCAANGKKPGS